MEKQIHLTKEHKFHDGMKNAKLWQKKNNIKNVSKKSKKPDHINFKKTYL